MIALVRSELMQARTLRSTYGIGLLVLVMVVGITWADLRDATDLVTAQQRRAPLLADAGITLAFVGAILAATRVAGEFRFGTITHRVLAAPNRARLAAATLVTWIGLALVTAIVMTCAGLVVTSLVLSQRDLSLALSAGDAAGLFGRIVLAGTLFAAIGVAVGFITRSQQAAAIVIFGEFLAEKVLGGLLGGAGQFLPFNLLEQVLDEEAAHTGAAALVLAGLAVLLAALAVVLLRRRDITP